MGYSFTSPEVVSALVRAKRRGVDVKIVLDEKGNRSKTSQAAMNVVVNAGIPLRTNGHYAIMHDKVIIVDNHTVEAGSFNYTRSAASRIARMCWLLMRCRKWHKPTFSTGSRAGTGELSGILHTKSHRHLIRNLHLSW